MPQRSFLGVIITFSGISNNINAIINSKLENIITNVSSCMIRDEYKLRVYTQYAVPSIKVMLTVHELTDTQLENLTTCTPTQSKLSSAYHREALLQLFSIARMVWDFHVYLISISNPILSLIHSLYGESRQRCSPCSQVQAGQEGKMEAYEGQVWFSSLA